MRKYSLITRNLQDFIGDGHLKKILDERDLKVELGGSGSWIFLLPGPALGAGPGPGLTNFNQSGPGPKILDPTGSTLKSIGEQQQQVDPIFFCTYE